MADPAPPCRLRGDRLTLRLHVQPRASRTAWGELHGGRIKLYLTSPPVDGKANAALRAFLAGEFGVPKGRVRILRGASGRDKTVEIHAPVSIPEWIQRLDLE